MTFIPNTDLNITGPLTSFGEALFAELTPVAQLDFVYGLNMRITTSTVTGSGSVTAASNLCVVDTTAAASSTAQLTSRGYLKYRAGQGGLGRFTAMFTTGVANSLQYAGIGTPSMNNFLGFGYNGTAYGIWHINGGSATHIPQASWNRDTCSGAGGAANASGYTLTPTNLQVHAVRYQYLGAGNIAFYVENDETGRFILVHIIERAGQFTATSLTQPSFNLIWRAVNSTNATSIVVQGGSGGLFLEGTRHLLGPTGGYGNTKSSVTTETNMLTIKNCTTYNTITNRGQIKLRTVSFGANTGGSTNGIAFLRVLKNATLNGTPNYTPYSGSTADNGTTLTSALSIVSVDVAGTTISAVGEPIFNGVVAIGNSSNADVSNLDLFANPGETLTISIESSQSATVGAGVSWTEDI